MKSLLALLLSLFALTASAQEVKNQFAFGPEFSFPTGYFGRSYNPGLANNVRLLLAVNTTSQVGITTGYGYFNAKSNTDLETARYVVIPVLLGYRNFVDPAFYLEPQAGIGFYDLRVRYNGIKESNTEKAFTWSIGAGFYSKGGFDLGIRFQSGLTKVVTTNQVVLRVNYHINLTKKD